MFKAKKISAIISFVVVTVVSVEASAYTRLKCNGNETKRASGATTVRAEVAFGTSGTWFNALNDSVNLTNQNPSNFQLTLQTGDNSIGQNNGQNEIWWQGANLGAPAVTYTQYDCANARILESDVVFNNTTAWTTTDALNSMMSFGGSKRSFKTVAIHEFGHVAGLGHTTDVYSVMGSDFTHVHVNGSLGSAYVGGDATRGVVDVYGARGTRRDMSVTNMKWSGSAGGYSTHAPTLMTTSTGGSLLTFKDVNGVTGYRVNRGQAIKAAFNFENLGNQLLDNIRFDYYISADNTISNADTNISAGILFNQPVGTVYNVDWPITIPANLTVGGTYYLGVIIDSDNKISEVNETNNWTYIPIRIN